MAPTLALEMLRVAAGAPGLSVLVVRGGIQGVGVGELSVSPRSATARCGSATAGPTPARFVSAADVLAGAVAPDVFEHKLVLVGVTALGLSDRRTTPAAGRMDGVEIHAELIESILDGALLSRPPWAPLGRGGISVRGRRAPGPRAVRPSHAREPAPAAGLVALAIGGSLALYHWRLLLLDAARPVDRRWRIVFTAMLSLTLAETERQRRALRRQVEQQREAAARLEGELSAARRIQMGILPKPADVFTGEKRFDLSTRARAGPRGGRRPLRLLHAGRRPSLLHDRRRLRQGPGRQPLHGGEQVALQEHRAAPRRRPWPR